MLFLLSANHSHFLLNRTVQNVNAKLSSTPQPEYELAVSFAKQIFQSPPYNNYESDLYRHFSTLLSTDTNKITVTKENFRELVTVLRRYPRCDLKIVPRLEPQSDQKLPAPAEPSQTEEIQDIEHTQDIDNDSQESASTVGGEPKRTPNTPRKPKQVAKSVPPSEPPSQQSPIDSPQGKIKRSTARSLGTMPKLCNPSEIATVHRDHLSLLDNNFLPLLENISGEQFFHRVVQHCSSNKGKNCILVSRPFKSTTVKVDGAPLVVRQVSVTFIHFVLVLQRSYTCFFSPS